MDFLNTALVKFRSRFRNLFPYNTDASIELIDALSSNANAGSVVQLSENACYTRHYTTLTAAISSFYKPKDKKAEDYPEYFMMSKASWAKGCILHNYRK